MRGENAEVDGPVIAEGSGPRGGGGLLGVLTRGAGRADRLVHVEHIPAREAITGSWPDWIDPALRTSLEAQGISAPWAHQVEAADLAHNGTHVVISTGTASGKSIGYLMPALTSALAGTRAMNGRDTTVLYISPTKALAHDQLNRIRSLDLPSLRAAAYDGDTPREERTWVRAHASYVVTNPDLVHRSLLPGHESWKSFLRKLTFVVLDECHVYRGVFGSHTANVIRRLRRVANHYGADPVFICSSATIADPAPTASRLTGLPMSAVTSDCSPRGASSFALWEPPIIEDAPRSAIAETADLLADLVVEGASTLAFARSRRAAEIIALATREHLGDVDASLRDQVAAYRGGYLPDERRELESALRDGRLRALATTNALELGIDITGLDAVLMCGWPGTRAALWQQAGRAGRGNREALALFVARDDPLDTYLVHHPAAIFSAPIEATVCDPGNPYILGPHLCAAAAELPLQLDDLPIFAADDAHLNSVHELLDELVHDGYLRRRRAGWFWTRPERAADLADLRGTGDAAVRIVEESTGRLLGTVDAGAAHSSVHPGAIYLHQGLTYLVGSLDLDAHDALVEPVTVDYSTHARDVSELRIMRTDEEVAWGEASLAHGVVDVTSQVVSFLRRREITGAVIDETPLDLPPRQLTTHAVWWTVSATQLERAGLGGADVPGAAHAAEHASIGLLPLFASCDRWDIGGISTALHPDTERATVVVYDGSPGGAGFAERGFATAREWLSATRDLIAGCACKDGCPSCVQSPKCGNGNEPLDKYGAVRLLTVLLADPLEPELAPLVPTAPPARPAD